MGILEDINTLLDNKNVNSILSLIIALYAALAAPALPNSVVLFFDTVLGKLLLIFLIGYVSSRNMQVALMIAVAFVVTLHVGNQRSIEEYINYRNREFFEGTKLTCDCRKSEPAMPNESPASDEEESPDETVPSNNDVTDANNTEDAGQADGNENTESFEDNQLTEQFISGDQLTEDNKDYDIEDFNNGSENLAGIKFFSNNGVQPADNLTGDTSKMYAPI